MNFMMLTNTMDYSQPISGLADKLSFGGMIVLLGVAAVFSVLTIIWLSLTIFKAVFRLVSDKKENKSVAGENLSASTPVQDNSEEEIAAVIAAAIAMAESESGNNNVKFKVVSFRRV